jgi:WD40 repeat protein
VSVVANTFTNSPANFSGSHDDSVTSVAVLPNGKLVGTDRSTDSIVVFDPRTKTVLSTVALGGHPDYVRYVSKTNELWVSEPDSTQIEIYSAPTRSAPTPTYKHTLAFQDGPESLTIDETRGVAYTNASLTQGADVTTITINLQTRNASLGWTSGCATAKEIEIDSARSLAFNVCAEGGVYSVDLTPGQNYKILDHLDATQTGVGVDIPGYSPTLGHLYIASGNSGSEKLTILNVSNAGHFTVLGAVATALLSTNAIADDAGNVWVPRPYSADVLRIRDPYVASAP